MSIVQDERGRGTWSLEISRHPTHIKLDHDPRILRPDSWQEAVLAPVQKTGRQRTY